MIDTTGKKEDLDKIFWKNRISWGELRRAQDQRDYEKIFMDVAYCCKDEVKLKIISN